ncbi:MAG: hypothetical protein AB7V36_12330 [Bacteroidales bacterium]
MILTLRTKHQQNTFYILNEKWQNAAADPSIVAEATFQDSACEVSSVTSRLAGNDTTKINKRKVCIVVSELMKKFNFTLAEFIA